MCQGCLTKASLNLSLVPQVWTELGAIRIHVSVHTDAHPMGLQTALAAF